MKFIQSIWLLAAVLLAVVGAAESREPENSNVIYKTKAIKKVPSAPKIKRTVRVVEPAEPQRVEMSNIGPTNQVEVKPNISIEQRQQPQDAPLAAWSATDEEVPADIRSANSRVSPVPYKKRKLISPMRTPQLQLEPAIPEPQVQYERPANQVVIVEQPDEPGDEVAQLNDSNNQSKTEVVGSNNNINEMTLKSGNQVDNIVANSGNRLVNLANSNNNAKLTTLSNSGNSETVHIDGVGNHKVTKITNAGNKEINEISDAGNEQRSTARVIGHQEPGLRIKSTGSTGPLVQINMNELTNRHQERQVESAPVNQFIVPILDNVALNSNGHLVDLPPASALNSAGINHHRGQPLVPFARHDSHDFRQAARYALVQQTPGSPVVSASPINWAPNQMPMAPAYPQLPSMMYNPWMYNPMAFMGPMHYPMVYPYVNPMAHYWMNPFGHGPKWPKHHKGKKDKRRRKEAEERELEQKEEATTAPTFTVAPMTPTSATIPATFSPREEEMEWVRIPKKAAVTLATSAA